MSNSVLIIDDSQAIREKVISILESRKLFTRFHQAEDGLDGFKKLLVNPVDIIICDLEMPRMDGFKFLVMMKNRPDLCDTPVIILTGNDDRDLKIKGLEQGASDFITKPFDPEELIARMNVHLKIKKLQDELKKSNELLLELSNTDHLTGLYNRRFLMEVLEREVQRASRKDGQLGLLLMDIDHFKRVNDTFGHLQGDVVLQSVARLIQKELRSYDVAARYGGEEFVALLPDTALQETMNVAERIRQAVQDMRFAGPLAEHQITVSIGVSFFRIPCTENIDDLLKSADEALYRAKENGRNQVILSDRECIQGAF